MTGRTAVLMACLLIASTAEAQTAPNPFGYDRSLPLEARDSVLGIEDGVSVRAISFRSPGGGRATGLLFVPSGTGPFAGVIVQHGAPGRVDSTIMDLLHNSVRPNALPIAKAGAVVIALDAPWARQTVGPISFTPRDSAFQVQLIVDLQRAVDYLLGRRDVDPKRLGYVGRSYGGAMGGLFAGVEKRLQTYVLQVGDGGLVAHITADFSAPPPGVTTESWNGWLAAMRPIEPIRYVGRAAPASLYLQSGTKDEAVSQALARGLHEAASQPKEIAWYEAGHGLNDQSRIDMLTWLSRKIGTRAP